MTTDKLPECVWIAKKALSFGIGYPAVEYREPYPADRPNYAVYVRAASTAALPPPPPHSHARRETTMGAKVPRYTPHGYSVGMRATHEGDYVRWHDYESLEAKLREIVESARLAEFHFRQWDEAMLPGEKAHSLKYMRGEMDNIRAAILGVNDD